MQKLKTESREAASRSVAPVEEAEHEVLVSNRKTIAASIPYLAFYSTMRAGVCMARGKPDDAAYYVYAGLVLYVVVLVTLELTKSVRADKEGITLFRAKNHLIWSIKWEDICSFDPDPKGRRTVIALQDCSVKMLPFVLSPTAKFNGAQNSLRLLMLQRGVEAGYPRHFPEDPKYATVAAVMRRRFGGLATALICGALSLLQSGNVNLFGADLRHIPDFVLPLLTIAGLTVFFASLYQHPDNLRALAAQRTLQVLDPEGSLYRQVAQIGPAVYGRYRISVGYQSPWELIWTPQGLLFKENGEPLDYTVKDTTRAGSSEGEVYLAISLSEVERIKIDPRKYEFVPE